MNKKFFTQYSLVCILQNSPLTRWWWKMWQHQETGRIVLKPWYFNLGPQYLRCRFKE